MRGSSIGAATARGLMRVSAIKNHFNDPPPLRVSLIRESVAAIRNVLAGKDSQPALIADLPDWPKRHLLDLNGTRADILVIDGHVELAIIIPSRPPSSRDEDRRKKLEDWAAQDPVHFHLLVDEPPEVKSGTPEAIYKIANSTVEQEEKRFNDVETKARNFFAGNSVVLGAGGLGIANALGDSAASAAFKQWIGVICMAAAVFGVIASVVFHVVQRAKHWSGRPAPVKLLEQYHCHGADHVYLASAKVLEASYLSLSALNDRSTRILAGGIWLSLVSLALFFLSMLMLMWGTFFG